MRFVYRLAPLMLMVGLAVALACSSEDEESLPAAAAPAAAAAAPAAGAPAAPAAPAAAAVAGAAPAAVAPAAPAAPAVAAPAPAARPIVAPAPDAGTLIVALVKVGSPGFGNGKGGNTRTIWGFGVCETLAELEIGTQKNLPQLAESWEIAADRSMVTVKLKKGIQFHDGWGELTAEDVAWSYNDAGADNLESVWDDAGEFENMFDRWRAVDTYTVEAPIDTFRVDMVRMSMAQGGSAPCVFSKKVYDQLGSDDAFLTMVGSGPYVAKEWPSGERFVGEAVQGHWRATPGFNELRVLEVPEEASRVAMVGTREADISEVALKSVAGLLDQGFKANDKIGLNTRQAISFGGNFWQQTDGNSGESIFPRPGFKPDKDHPWIGDPRDPDHMERARKVRWALSMAIDREGIAESILDGLGRAADVAWLSGPNLSKKRPEWNVPYDPQMALQYLADAGYSPSDIKIPLFIPVGAVWANPEIGEAVAAGWENLGIDVTIDRATWSARRPLVVSREIDFLYLNNIGGNDGLLIQSNPAYIFAQPGFNPGYETDEFWEWFVEQAGETNAAKAEEIVLKRIDFYQHWMLNPSVVEMPKIFVENPERVTGWASHYDDVGIPGNFFNAQPAQ